MNVIKIGHRIYATKMEQNHIRGELLEEDLKRLIEPYRLYSDPKNGPSYYTDNLWHLIFPFIHLIMMQRCAHMFDQLENEKLKRELKENLK